MKREIQQLKYYILRDEHRLIGYGLRVMGPNGLENQLHPK